MAYTLVPVDGWEGFRTAMTEHGEQAHSVVLLNCGATEPLIPYLRSGMTLYVIDSRRPLNLSNVSCLEITMKNVEKVVMIMIVTVKEKLVFPFCSSEM